MCPAGAISPKTYANFHTKPHAVFRYGKLWRLGPPYRVGKETVMKEQDKCKTVSVREMHIGDTLCIIESVVSINAKETAYNKIKRLIMDGADRCEQPPRAA